MCIVESRPNYSAYANKCSCFEWIQEMDVSSIITGNVLDTYAAAETLLKLREGTDTKYENGICVSSSRQPCEEIVENYDFQRNFLKHTSESLSKPSDIQLINDSSPNLTCANGDVIRKCKVCGDKAQLKHYGAISCEGCKSFFRRCVLQKASYKCNSGFLCVVTKASRKHCGACRYRKCVDSGMIPDAVGALANRRIKGLRHYLPLKNRMKILFQSRFK